MKMDGSVKNEDQKRLAELTTILGAVAGDVFYDRVTPEALQANLLRLQGRVSTWIEDVKKRPRGLFG